MRSGKKPERTGDLHEDAIADLVWARSGAGLTIGKLVEMTAVQRLPRVAAALDGVAPADVPRVAYDALVSALRDLGQSPHARLLRAALAVDYEGTGKDVTARREEFMRDHNAAAKTAGQRNQLPETHRALREIENAMIETLVTALGAPQGTAAEPDAPEPAARAAANAPLPRQLPAAASAFVGRAAALDWFDEAIRERSSAPAVLAVYGAPGIGKTALALQWAHRVAADFPDGQLWLDLRGHSHAGAPTHSRDAITHLLLALGVAPDTVPAGDEQLANLYRSLTAGTRRLIVLDNAASSEQVAPLIPGEPGCVVIVTSRDALLGLAVSHGARPFTLDVLSPHEAIELLSTILGASRVADEPDAAADVAALCGYLPLALRIVAAKLATERHGTLAGMAERLRQSDRLSALGFDDSREGAVRGAFELSYRSLSPEEQRAFRLLGLVAGASVTADAVARLLDVEPAEARRLLDRLVTRHLVLTPTAQRFGLHDLLRDFAYDLSTSVDGADARGEATARLLAYYIHRTVAATTTVHPKSLRLPGDEPDDGTPAVTVDSRNDAVEWLTGERANLTAAVVQAAARGYTTAAWQLAYAARGWFVVQPIGAEWLTIGQAGLAAATEDGHEQAISAMHGLLGRAYRQLGDLDTATRHVRDALTASERAEWDAGKVIAHCALGGIFQDQARLEAAIEHHAAALAIERSAGRHDAGAVHLSNLGATLLQRGDYADAAANSTAALEIAERTYNDRTAALSLDVRAAARYQLGELAAAAEDAEAAVRIARLAGLADVEAACLATLAYVRADLGDAEAATRHAAESQGIADRLDDRRTQAVAANATGAVALRAAAYDDARRAFEDARAMSESVGYRFGSATAQLGLARVAAGEGALDETAVRAKDAVTAAQEGGFLGLEAQARALLG